MEAKEAATFRSSVHDSLGQDATAPLPTPIAAGDRRNDLVHTQMHERAHRSAVARFALDLYFIVLVVALTFGSFVLIEALTRWGAGSTSPIEIVMTADSPEIMAGYTLLATISVGLQAGIRIPSRNSTDLRGAGATRAKFLRPFVVLTQVGTISLLAVTWQSYPWKSSEINVGALAGPALVSLIVFGLCSDALHGHRFSTQQAVRVQAVENRVRYWLEPCLRHSGLRRALQRLRADFRSRGEARLSTDREHLIHDVRSFLLSSASPHFDRSWKIFHKKAGVAHICGCSISGAILTLLAFCALEQQNYTMSDTQKTMVALLVLALLVAGSQVITYGRKLILINDWVSGILLFFMWLVASALYSLPYCLGMLNIRADAQVADISLYVAWASFTVALTFLAAVMGKMGSITVGGDRRVVLLCAAHYRREWLREQKDARESDVIGTVMQLRSLAMIPVIGPPLSLYVADTALDIPDEDRLGLEQFCGRITKFTTVVSVSIGVFSIIVLSVIASKL